MNSNNYLMVELPSCSMGCENCQGNKTALPSDYKEQIIKELRSQKVWTVFLAGGEPLCERNVLTTLSLVTYLKINFLQIGIFIISSFSRMELVKRKDFYLIEEILKSGNLISKEKFKEFKNLFNKELFLKE